MKASFCVCLALLGTISTPSVSQGRWTRQSPAPDLRSVVFFDEQHGIAVGTMLDGMWPDVGAILCTSDGGSSWSYRSVPSIGPVLRVTQAGPSTAFAVGEGCIVKTTDMGDTWTRQDGGTTVALNGISITDGQNGTAVGVGTVLRTTDGGSSWANISRGTINNLLGLAFADSTRGLAVGAQGTILRTTDAGMTWHNAASPTGASLAAVSWVDSNAAIAIGSEWTGSQWPYLATGLLLRSVDGGEHWNVDRYNWGSAPVDLHSSVSGSAHLVGDDLLLCTTDEGRTWRDQTNGTTRALHTVVMVDSSTWLAADELGRIIRTTDAGLTWTHLRGNDPTVVSEIVSGGSGMLLAVAHRERYSAFQQCEVYRSSDAGATWTPLTDPPIVTGIALDYEDGASLMLLGQRPSLEGDVRVLLRSTDLGESWNETHVFDRNRWLEGLANATAERSVLVGRTVDSLGIERGSILLTRDGGITWTEVWQDQQIRPAAVAFIDSLTGIAVGSTTDAHTVVLRTTDGGSSWVRLSLTGYGSFHRVALQANHGIIIGTTDYSGTPRPLVIATSDSGRTWTAAVPSAGSVVHDVSMNADGTGVIVGAYGNVWFTSDGGRTMQTRSGSIRGNFRSISFSDSVHGMVGGTGLDTAGRTFVQLLRTSNGGDSWVAIRSGITGDLVKVVALDNDRSIAVSTVYDQYSSNATGQIFLTTNGGTSWSQQRTVSSTSLTSIAKMNQQTVLIGGQAHQTHASVLLRSTDGGATWIDISPAWSAAINGIARPADSLIVLVGGAGMVLRSSDNGATWTDHTGPLRNTLLDVRMKDADGGVAIEDRSYGSAILLTTDSGSTWTDAYVEYSVELQRLSFASPDVGFAVGYAIVSADKRPGIVVRTTDGGRSWAIVNLATDASLTDVKFWGGSNGRIVGYQNERTTSFRTTDQGASWTEEPIGDFGYIADVATPSPSFSVAVGGSTYNWWTNGGTIIRTTDGGLSWTEPYATRMDLADVAFADLSTGIAVGSRGTIVQTSNASRSWRRSVSPTSVELRSVAMADMWNATAVGDSGTILRSTDGGFGWTQLPHPTQHNLNSVSFAGGSMGIVVGDSGTILRTSDGGASWVSVDSLSRYSLTNVAHASPQVAVAAGHEPGWMWESDTTIILRTIDGGITWSSEVVGPFEGRPSGVHFATPLVGYISLDSWDGGLLRTTDAGLTWNALSVGGEATIEDVFASDEQCITVVGTHYGFHCEKGFIATSTDGGRTWQRETGACGRGLRADPRLLNVWESLMGVHFSDRVHGTVVGRGGAIFRTSDGGTSWSEGPVEPTIPRTTELYQNFPNPFNPTTTIRYQTSGHTHVRLTIHDLLGREVAVLVDEAKPAGTHTVSWNASSMPSGVYFCTIKVGAFVQARRMLMVK